jgi:hypothetical protein
LCSILKTVSLQVNVSVGNYYSIYVAE